MDCKLCLKRFSNAKALGAHMRSHYAILPLPRRSPPDPHRFKRRRDQEEAAAATTTAAAELEMEEGDVALCLIMLSRDVWSDSGGGKGGKIHRCEKCGKVFKSSQGLGSHKASHLKRRIKESESSAVTGDDDNQVHECEFCPRSFNSAQALGGHKRSHFPARNLVDLNLPPAAAIGVVNGEILA